MTENTDFADSTRDVPEHTGGGGHGDTSTEPCRWTGVRFGGATSHHFTHLVFDRKVTASVDFKSAVMNMFKEQKKPCLEN